MNFYISAFSLLLTLYSWAEVQQKPNILWLTSEDNNVNYLGCYGNELAVTPNIDTLASKGFRYTHCYSNGAVCSATRSSWIMGMISTSTGAHHHRSQVTIPESLIMYPKALTEAGYYTANGYKCDYNIQYGQELWEGGHSLDWKLLQKRQPFFQIINFKESHEHKLFSTEHKHPIDQIKIAPYHPTTDISKKNTAVYYDAITAMDKKVGEALDQLQDSGLAENTIVIYCSDHGGSLPRGKRFLYNSGTHCPLIVYIPESLKHLYPAEHPGSTVQRLVSFADMPTTWLSLAGAKIPANYHGKVFLGNQTQPEDTYHYSFRSRNGERIENVRAIRDKKYLLIKNYYPYVPRGQRQDYQWGIPLQQEWYKEFQAGKLNAIQARYYLERGSYELYDTEADPHCIHNEILNPQLKNKIAQLKAALLLKQQEIRDCALIPESMLIRLSSEAGLTHYEFLQSESNYPIETLQTISDIALSPDPSALNTFTSSLKHSHPAVRYWALQGLFNLGPAAAPAKAHILEALDDHFDTVAVSAAICALKLDEQEAGYTAIRNTLKRDAITRIDILNQIAWLGSSTHSPLHTEIAALQNLEGIDYQMQQFILTGKASRKKIKKKK